MRTALRYSGAVVLALMLSMSALAQVDVEVEFKVDMSVEIATGNFDATTDLVVVAGSMNGWDTTADTLVQDFVNPNLFSKLVNLDTLTVPDTLNYKFVTRKPNPEGGDELVGWESVDNRVLIITGEETDVDENGRLDVDPGAPTFNNAVLEDFFAQAVTATFEVDLRPAFYFFADSLFLPSDIQTGETVEAWNETVFANGPMSGATGDWADWGPDALGAIPELQLFDDGMTGGDATAGDSVYTFQVMYEQFSSRKGAMKFGTDGYDNESLFGANHILAIPDDAAEVTIPLIFGAMETSTGIQDALYDPYISIGVDGLASVVRTGGTMDPIDVPQPADVEIDFKLDMSVEIATGNFDAASDLVVVAGDFNGWDTTADTLVQDFVNPNLFSKLVNLDTLAFPDTLNYKFVTRKPDPDGGDELVGWESVDNRVLVITGEEADVDENGRLDVDPGTPSYNNAVIEDFFAQAVTATFEVDLRPAFYFFADSLFLPSDIQTGENVEAWNETVFANGPMSGATGDWADWGPDALGAMPELQLFDDGATGGDATAGDTVYTFQVAYPAFSSRKGAMKFGTDGYDNESLFGANHMLDIPDDAPEVTIPLIFGAMEVGGGEYQDALYDPYIALTYGGPGVVVPMVVRRGGDVGDTGVGVEELDLAVPDKFVLGSNYPNPFNPSTSIEYQVASTEHVSINVYDISGRLVEKLVDQVQSPASYRVTFDAASLASGTYLYQLRAGDTVITKKMLLIK